MALQEMSTVIKYDQEKLDVDGLPEYIRDTDSPARDAFGSISTRSLAEREAKRLSAVSERQSQKDTGGFANIFSDVQTPPADELEALWPGAQFLIFLNSFIGILKVILVYIFVRPQPILKLWIYFLDCYHQLLFQR